MLEDTGEPRFPEQFDPRRELDWGQAQTLGGTVIHTVPALHFAGVGQIADVAR